MKPYIKYAIYTVIVLAALFAGLIVGYVVLGHRPMSEVFDLGTWTHLIDLVFGE